MSDSPAPKFSDVYAELMSSTGLSQATTRAVFDAIFAGAWTPSQIGGFLVALRQRGETSDVVAGAASAMRAAMLPVSHAFPKLLDTCGTGGDGSGSLNLSTGAALVAAAAGVRVAKHGNRAATSRSGSADVLESLGIPLDVPAAAQGEVLGEAGIAFLFAMAHHPAMRHAMPTRRELGIRTLFNLLGPLSNPAGVTHQLLGAPDDTSRKVLAEALVKLGVARAWVVRSVDGLDEVSPFAETRITEVDGGTLREHVVSPESFGFAPSPEGAIAGGEPADNARALTTILGGGKHPAADAVALNAAAALVVFHGMSERDAGAQSREILASGKPLQTLTTWSAAANKRRPQRA
ncbi:MAG: Anthranilate phosphoribosyltransferase [Polyangiaceae bacterium]|jgi:anthranilate phosphoribosyltransferase|nr:Anthranilate phosphoribosyltransferase [Polyangiaceae bacterium]